MLRLWEPAAPLVVVGRGSHVGREVDLAACRHDSVPVLRRSSGGGAIVGGRLPDVCGGAVAMTCGRSCDRSTRRIASVLETLAGGLAPFSPDVARRGTSDLAIGELKFSGNSLARAADAPVVSWNAALRFFARSGSAVI